MGIGYNEANPKWLKHLGLKNIRKPAKNQGKPSGNQQIFARLANEFPQWREDNV
jgi:hypothetical protein